METFALKVSAALFVISERLIRGVLAAIDFDYKPRAEAAEIGDVGADWNLASKMCVAQRQTAT